MRIFILILLIINIVLIGFGLKELKTIKQQLKPLKIFFRLYSEQSDDIKKKIGEIKKDKDLRALSDQEIKNKFVNQFQLEQNKKEIEKNRLKMEREKIKNFILEIENR